MQELDQDSFEYEFPLSLCRELSLFGALSDEALSFLIEQGVKLSYTKGEFLFKLGNPSDCFFIIIDGQLDYYRYVDETQIFIRSYYPGEQVGYISMIGLHDRQGDIIVKKSTTVLVVSSDLFHQVCSKYSQDFVVFLINMTREMSREITDLDSLCAARTMPSINRQRRPLLG